MEQILKEKKIRKHLEFTELMKSKYGDCFILKHTLKCLFLGQNYKKKRWNRANTFNVFGFYKSIYTNFIKFLF